LLLSHSPLSDYHFFSDAAINVGHQPDEPSDHADSTSEGGTMDEGELDDPSDSEIVDMTEH
jgi:hypothetical protein